MGKRGKQNLSLDDYSDKLFTLADANGYEPGRHRDEDSERNKFNYAKESSKHHDSSLRRYLAWRFRQMKIENNKYGLPSPTSDVEKQWLGKGTPAPHLVDLKDFMPVWAKTSQPRIVEKPTVVSGESFAKNLFTGFKKMTGTSIAEEDSDEVYYWIRNALTSRRRNIYLPDSILSISCARFGVRMIQSTFRSDIVYNSNSFSLSTTGPVLGFALSSTVAFCTSTLAIQRVLGGWRLIYQLDQHWVKGNRSPEHIAYGIAGSGHPVFMFDETAPFLALALADNAIRDVKTLDDLRQIRLKPGEDFRRLKFNKEVEELPILRKFESGCVTEKPMPKHEFVNFLNGGADPFSFWHFQGYSNIKRSIRHGPEDLLATKGIATAALTLIDTELQGSRRLLERQRRLLRQHSGEHTPADPEASNPFARERRRIGAAVDAEEYAFRMEQVISIDPARLQSRQRTFAVVLQPIFQIMRFFLREPDAYVHILRSFRPAVFPGVLGAFARVFECGLDDLGQRMRGMAQAQRNPFLHLALAEGLAAIDRLGSYCFTGFSRSLMPVHVAENGMPTA